MDTTNFSKSKKATFSILSPRQELQTQVTRMLSKCKGEAFWAWPLASAQFSGIQKSKLNDSGAERSFQIQ